MAGSVGFNTSGANPFNWLANKAAKLKGSAGKASQIETRFDSFQKRVIEKGVVKPGRLYGMSEDFGSGTLAKAYRAGMTRAMQEHVDAYNQNLSATQHQNKPTEPVEEKPAAPAKTGQRNIKLNPKQKTEPVQEKPMEQATETKNPFSNPPASRTKRGVPVLGDKGMRRMIKNQVGKSKPKAQKGPGGAKKMRGGPKK